MDDITLKYVLQTSTSMAAPDSVPFNKQRMQRLRDVKPVWLPHNLVLALNCIELCSLTEKSPAWARSHIQGVSRNVYNII